MREGSGSERRGEGVLLLLRACVVIIVTIAHDARPRLAHSRPPTVPRRLRQRQPPTRLSLLLLLLSLSLSLSLSLPLSMSLLRWIPINGILRLRARHSQVRHRARLRMRVRVRHRIRTHIRARVRTRIRVRSREMEEIAHRPRRARPGANAHPPRMMSTTTNAARIRQQHTVLIHT